MYNISSIRVCVCVCDCMCIEKKTRLVYIIHNRRCKIIYDVFVLIIILGLLNVYIYNVVESGYSRSYTCTHRCIIYARTFTRTLQFVLVLRY